MLMLKYHKIGECKFLPHLDVLRHITRTIRRAKIPVEFSNGFNPHMQINLSPPIPLGVESMAEYCFVNTELSPRDFRKLYNDRAIKGLECEDAVVVEKNPNIAGLSHSAEYIISADDIENRCDEIKEILAQPQFFIEYYSGGKIQSKEVKSYILSYQNVKGGLRVILRTGNENLRADRFAFNLTNLLEISANSVNILKTKHFILTNGKVIDVDKL